MNSYIRGLAGAFVLAGVMGVVGCGPDNESEASKTAATNKDPNAKAIEAPKFATSQKDAFSRMPDPKSQMPKAKQTPKDTPAPEK